MEENDPSVVEIIKGFPRYFGGYVFGFALGVLCDVTLTSLALGSAALGWATTWQLGVAAFFAGHFSIRSANARGQAIVQAGREARVPLGRIANILETPPVIEEKPSADETPAT